MNWFENWFDSKYYHILYQNRDNNEASLLIDNILKKFTPHKDAYFLDLGCGTGRHAIHLNQEGFKVDGFDLSKKSLEIANKHSNDKLQFHHKDMRFFDVKNKYDFILNLFTSFGYFEGEHENEKILKNIERSLKINGIFILDFLNAKKTIQELQEFEEKNISNINFKIHKTYDNHFIYKKISITDKKQTFRFTEKVQLLNKEHFIKYLKNLNMNLLYTFGDYNLNNFNPLLSERLLLVFQKY